MESPAHYASGNTPPHRAWATIGEILFWTHRKSHIASGLWDRFEGPTRLAVADVLYHIAQCRWKVEGEGHSVIDLVSTYPNDIRQIVEDCVRERASLPSVFNYGGSRDRSVVSYLFEVLGKIGDENSARLLQESIDDLAFGRDAIRAIESIRRPAVQPTS
jgi:hypothetical protein